jgi:hypothetical protein
LELHFSRVRVCGDVAQRLLSRSEFDTFGVLVAGGVVGDVDFDDGVAGRGSGGEVGQGDGQTGLSQVRG